MVKDQAARLRQLMERKQKGEEDVELAGSNTRIIAVASGKGGVGKSNVVTNLAIALSQKGKKVLVFDADLGMANLDILMGVVPRYTLYDVLYGKKELGEVIIDGPANIRLIPGGSGIRELANLEARRQETLLNGLKKLAASADFLLIDTGAGVSRSVLAFLGAAQEAIMVSTTEPTSVTDAYGIIKILARYGEHTNISTIINRVAEHQEGNNTSDKLKMTALRFLNLELETLGCIREDKLLIKAVKEQVPLLLKYPYSKAAEDINSLASRILDVVVEKPLGVQRFFHRLQRLFS